MVTWLPGYLVPGYLVTLVTWLPGLPGYLVTWLPGYLVTWLPGTWLLVTGYLVTWLPVTWLPGYLMASFLIYLRNSDNKIFIHFLITLHKINRFSI